MRGQKKDEIAVMAAIVTLMGMRDSGFKEEPMLSRTCAGPF